jgi:hypothetical protein
MPFIIPDTDDRYDGPDSNHELLSKIFSHDMIKMLVYHCCRVDIEDNNDKAVLLQELLGPEFIELGTGTNRMAFLYNPSDERAFKGGAGLVYKFALDRRGLVDNFTEFKRSQEAPEYFIKAYETNILILIEEYVTLIDDQEFRANENGIKTVLEDLAKIYIFEDIGFSLKNYTNWGYRSDGTITILDIGYVYPIKGNEHIMTCPKCKSELKYNSNYTGFICSNSDCRLKFTFLDLRRRMDLSLEDYENRVIAGLNNVEMPDFDTINETMTSTIDNETHVNYHDTEDLTPIPREINNVNLYKLLNGEDDEDAAVEHDDDYEGSKYPPSHDY